MTPILRFAEFTDDWEETTLENLAEVERGKFSVRPRNDPRYFGGEMPFVQTGDVTGSDVYLKGYSQTLNADGIKVSKVFPVDTILITIAANIGDTTITQYAVACPDSVVAIQAKKDLATTIFLKNLIDLQKENLDSQATQNAQKNINLQVLKPLQLIAPSKEEQTKIATFLSAVDEKISQLSQKLHLLGQYKQGMMQKLFSQQIRFKADDGSEFGEWEEILVQYLVDKGILEKPMDGNHGEIHPTSKDYVEEGIPFVMATDIFNGKLHLEQTKKLTKQQADSLRKGFSREGDVLLTHKANIGNVAIVPQLDVEYLMLTPQVTYYRVINFSRLNNNFLKVYFESPQFQKNLLDLCTGATRLYIGISEQRKLPISLPCLEEQTKIANFLSAIDQKIEVVAQQIEQAKTWKKGLLQQMFV